MNDYNPIAFVGPDHNGQSLLDFDTSDASVPGPGGIVQASAFKFTTQLQDFVFHAKKGVGGKDAVVDVNNKCRRLHVVVDEIWPTGQFAATLKGGSESIYFGGRLMRHAKKFDVIIGDWSDQSHDPTKGVVLNIIPDDGQPVVVCVLKGDKPTFVPGSGPYAFRFPLPDDPFHDLYVYCFETARRWGAFRGNA